MSVKIGSVAVFENIEDSKEQAVKVIEEAAEVFGAWQTRNDLRNANPSFDIGINNICCEIADVIQAACNLAAAIGVEDLGEWMYRCREKNELRGRAYQKPDSWKSIEEDLAENDPCMYFNEKAITGGFTCDDCDDVHHEDCTRAMARDIVARAKKLAGVA